MIDSGVSAAVANIALVQVRVPRSELAARREAIVTECVIRCGPTVEPGSEWIRNALKRDLVRIRGGRYEAAVESLRGVIRQTRSPLAYLLLAEAYLCWDCPKLALVALDVLSHTAPRFTEGALVKGLVEYEYGTTLAARATLQGVVKAEPSCLLAWKILIAMARECGAHQEAAKLAEAAALYLPELPTLAAAPQPARLAPEDL